MRAVENRLSLVGHLGDDDGRGLSAVHRAD
jgi:hypothetical protein